MLTSPEYAEGGSDDVSGGNRCGDAGGAFVSVMNEWHSFGNEISKPPRERVHHKASEWASMAVT